MPMIEKLNENFVQQLSAALKDMPQEEYARRTAYIRALRPHIVWVPQLSEHEFMQRYKPQKGPMR